VTSDNPLGPPPWLNAPAVDGYPYSETYDLRSGPDLHHSLLGLLPFVGLWRGRGQGGFPADADYDFAQEVRISHDGRPFLKFESRSWLLDDDSKPAGEWITELGYWRPVLVDGHPRDEMEATVITPEGVAELYVGKTIGTTRLEMEADAIAYTPTGQHRTGSHRLFGIASLVNALNGMARGAVLFVLIFFLQGPYGQDPLVAGLMMTPFGAAFLLIGPLSGYLSDTYGKIGKEKEGWLTHRRKGNKIENSKKVMLKTITLETNKIENKRNVIERITGRNDKKSKIVSVESKQLF